MLPVYCPLCCDQPFENQDGLFHHLRTLRNNLFCPICSERFSSFDLLVTHLSRKCHGPVSPREAKRRVLLNTTKCILPDTMEDLAFVSPSNLDPENVQGEGASESPSAKAKEPENTIPPEIRNRLPKGVTVSLGASDTLTSPQKNSTDAKPLRTPENNKSSTNPPAMSTNLNNSLSVVLNKVSLNTSVEISVNENKDDGSTSKKPLPCCSSVSIIENDSSSASSAKKPTKAGPLSSKLKHNTSLKRTLQVQKDDVPDSNSRSGSKKVKETPSGLSLRNENIKTGKRDFLNKTVPANDEKSSMMNGFVEKTSSETPVNEKRSKRGKINSSANSTAEMSNQRSMKTRGKKLKSFSELLNSDDSDHDEDSDFDDFASCNSDTSYESEEEQKSGKNKRESSSKTKINGSRKEKDKEVKVINEEPAKTTNDKDLVKANLEAGNNSCKAKSENKEELEHKNTPTVKEPNTTEGGKPEDSGTGETKTEEEEEYTCSACNIRFTSIYEHIKQYHNGQEVVVEVPEEEIQEDLKVYQENSKSLISIGDSESTDNTVIETEDASLVSVKEEKASPAPSKTRNGSLKGDKHSATRKKYITGFAAEGASDDLVYTRTFKKVKKETGEHWVELQSEKKILYQFVRDEDKFKRLMTELRNNSSIHPELKMPVKKLFENPKINVVEITFQPNTPFFTHKTINFKNPMPTFIVDRLAANSPEVLGGIASYIMAGKGGSVSEEQDSKIIGVMKVILASDKELTVENIVFNDKPANADMVPVLEDVKKPDIPLLKDAKILKWRCNRCLATTWKFPLHKETHYCNACPICHKTFISPVSLKKHLVLHKRDGTKYCKECQASFVSKATLNSHLTVHITHALCDKCHLFVEREKVDEHIEVHSKDPSEQFPCSVCKKVFGSGPDLEDHETKLCSKLVAKFNCSQCDKKFFTLPALTCHTTEHSKAAVKFTCRFCPKTFLREKEQCPKRGGKRKPSSFIQKIWHERIHTRDRPYLCKSCPKRFRSLAHELVHAKVHAPEAETPLRNVHVHMCTYCDRVFRTERQLTNHMTQHTTD